MREHYILNRGAYLKIVDMGTQLYIIITSTQDDRKLLVVMSMESRCGICPVIRKILQSWHSVRTERATANSWGEALQSGMCHRLPTTNVLSCTEPVASPWGAGHSLRSSQQSPPGAHDSLQSSPAHNQVSVRGTGHQPDPAQLYKSAKLCSHFSQRKPAGDVVPDSFYPQDPSILWPILNFIHACIHSFIQQYLWNTFYVFDFEICSSFYSFIHLFSNIYWPPTIHQVLLRAKMNKKESTPLKSSWSTRT